MNILWPEFLFLLLSIPLLIAGYVWMLRRRRRFVVRYSSLALVREALGKPSRLRRHLPFALFLLAIASLIGSLARPMAVVEVPTNQTSIILAIDVSRSMCATDIRPSRIDAAKAAALAFIDRQVDGTQIGIVAFAGFAVIAQPPTTDRDLLNTAIANLTPGRGTAIGAGIETALEAIARLTQPDRADSPPGSAATATPEPLPAGSYVPEIIVVLTDGVSLSGVDPLDAAQQAADRGVRVYTIGFGTENGGQTAASCGTSGFGGGGGRGGGFRRGIDEGALVAIAEMTGGDYYAASSAGELNAVFADLPRHFITTRETTEISVIFTALGALFVVLAVGLALRWNPLG